MKKKNFLMSVVLLGSMTFMWVSDVFGAYPLATDDAATVEQSKYELEFCYESSKESDGEESRSCGLSFKGGITEKMDVGVSFPITLKPKEYLGAATVGLKFLVIKDILAFTVSNELGSEEYLINGIFSWGILQGMLHLNLGCEYLGAQDNGEKVFYSVAFEYPIKKFDIVVESCGEKEKFQDYLVGIRYKPIDEFFVSVAYGNGFGETNEKITMGIHYEF